MNVELYTKRLFFGADITKNNKTVLSFYRKVKALNEVFYDYVIYPPLSALGQEKYPKDYTFQFRSHPARLFDFKEGELSVTVRQESKRKTYSPYLQFIFDTKAKTDKAFRILTKLFKGMSSSHQIKNWSGYKIAEFNIDNSKSITEIVICHGRRNPLIKEYVLVFSFSN